MQRAQRVGSQASQMGAAADRAMPEPLERFAPGLATFFDLSEDRSRALLDLGGAAGSSMHVYGRFARWIRFGDILSAATSPEEWAEAQSSLPPNPERPYDLIVAWDILDRLPPESRAALVKRLVEISAPGAKLYVVSASLDVAQTGLLSCTVEEIDRVRYEQTGERRPSHPPILPAEVQRIVEPFQVVRSFSSRVGLREYVAARGRAPG